MVISSLLRRLAKSLTRRRSAQRAGARLEIESLEERALPQSTPTIVVLGLADSANISHLTAPSTGHPNWTAPNLRSAMVNAAETGSSIDTIIVPPGVLNLTRGALEVKSDLTLSIRAAFAATAINAHLHSQILLVDSGGTLTAQNLVFTEGLSGTGGGAIRNDGVLTLNQCQVINSEVIGIPAALIVVGGGIDNEGALTMRNCLVAHNVVLGAVVTTGSGQQAFGGGLYNNGSLTVSNCTFSANQAIGGNAGGPKETYIQGGNAYGGAIAFAANAVGAVSINASTFNNNLAIGGKITVSASQGFGGYALGGGVFQDPNNAQTLTITNSTFAFNNATGGSAVAFDLESLGGGAYGGALYLASHAILINDTVAYNSAVGGMSSGSDVSPVQGGGVFSNTWQPGDKGPRVGNTIIAANFVIANPNVFLNVFPFNPASPSDVGGAFNSLGHNLIGTVNGATGFTTTLHDIFGGNGKAPVKPGLDTALRFNGGPTRTLALLPGSPAIDHGDAALLTTSPALSTDQRGVKRPKGAGVDIGAVEVIPPPKPVLLGRGR